MSNQIPPLAPVRVFDKNLNLLGEIDNYSSLTHTRGFNKPGAFSLVINWNLFDDTGTIQYAALFAKGGYIMIGGDPYKCGIITTIEYPVTQDGKGSQNITVSGFEPTILFNRRICDVPTESDNYIINTTDAETIIKTAISDQAGATATNTKRAFSLLTIATNQHRGINYFLSTNGKPLLDELTACSIATRLGFFIYLDTTNKKLVLDCSTGNHLESGNNPNVIFSTDYDSVATAKRILSDEQYKNVCTIAGQGQGQARPVLDVFSGSEPSDVDRYEMFVSDSSVVAAADLTAKANTQLGQYQYQNQFEASLLAYSPFIYGTPANPANYDLGDYTTIEAYDYSQNVQITAITEAWAPLSYTITPVFDKEPPELSSQVKQVVSQINNMISNQGSGKIQPVTTGTTIAQLTQDTTITVNSGSPSTQDINTNGASAAGVKCTFVNIGAGLVTINFDGSGTNPTLSQNASATFIWTGSAWLPLTPISGSNNNGSWTKYPDRKMRQDGILNLTSLAINNGVGAGIFRTVVQSISFPLSFAATTARLTLALQEGSNNLLWTSSSVTAASASSYAFFILSGTSVTGVSINVAWIAEGTW